MSLDLRERGMGPRSSADLLRAIFVAELYVEVMHLERIFLDEVTAGLDGVAHEHGEYLIGKDFVVDLHLE